MLLAAMTSALSSVTPAVVVISSAPPLPGAVMPPTSGALPSTVSEFAVMSILSVFGSAINGHVMVTSSPGRLMTVFLPAFVTGAALQLLMVTDAAWAADAVNNSAAVMTMYFEALMYGALL